VVNEETRRKTVETFRKWLTSVLVLIIASATFNISVKSTQLYERVTHIEARMLLSDGDDRQESRKQSRQ
jgi:hypothetical protein